MNLFDKITKFDPTQEWSRDIREKIRDGRVSYNKNLTTLSSGTLLLTFTIVQLLESTFNNPLLLKWGWIFFGLSVTCGVLSYFLIIHEDTYWHIGMRHSSGEQNGAEWSKDEKQLFFRHLGLSMKFARASFFFELGQLIAYLFGVILLVIFLFFNF